MITVQGLTKRYDGKAAVDDLTFSVIPGRVTGFLGPNGAGKSTTLRVMVGLDRPDTGAALLHGRPYAEFTHPLREVGAMLDAKAVHPGRSARDHLLALAQSNGIPARRVDEVLDVVGLTTVAGKRAGTFSLGMGQRLGMAAALLGDPGILIFDEPVNGLDPDGIRWLRGLLRSLAAEGRTVFFSSHVISEMQLTADHLIVIGRGKLVADGPAERVVATTVGAVVTVRSPDPAGLDTLQNQLTVRRIAARRLDPHRLQVDATPIEVVANLAHAIHLHIHELSRAEASLEEAYLRLTAGSSEFGAGDSAPAAST
ncbi:ATP-binding cassette domain-containing protein [Micromonospora sp. NPDC048843]|uniref:ATP-binding cassette domain-containing protein n=1 Tax=Micromonospora sp. NPDC048843 TaxID=3155389 RepID=UPI0033D52FCB